MEAQQLLDDPKSWSHEEVSVHGWFFWSSENLALYATNEMQGNRIWVALMGDTLVRGGALQRGVMTEVEIDGRFCSGKRGHLGAYDGMIDRISEVRILCADPSKDEMAEQVADDQLPARAESNAE